ncbi:MAG TPA: heavy metal-binding domain-containing protein [Kofleriaceae bacterium]|nr:heavy metal-binding domain-containing protein [Kofleriaceae bacterium]
MQPAPRSPDGSALVLLIRMLLVAVAAGAVGMAVVVSRGGVGGPGSPDAAAHRRYVCPMHSEVTSSAPGDCPICGMALEEADPSSGTVGAAMRSEATAGGAQAIALATLRNSAEATSLLRFSVAPVRRNALPGEIYAPATVEPDGTIVAQLYRDEVVSLAPDETAELVPATSPGTPVRVQRDDAPPLVSYRDDAIARVRFRAVPGAAALRPGPAGLVGWLKLAYRTRAMLVVRSTSILHAREGHFVLVFSAQAGQLTRRRVEIGKEYSGMTAIVSGLRDKEFVVMANTAALDAERRLQAGP